jgi:ankyrin repeat protein
MSFQVKLRGFAAWGTLGLLLAASGAMASDDLRVVEAAKNRDREALRSLLEAKADVNAAQPDGATALHWAAHWDDLETVELLIRAGAASDVSNDYGVTPLSLAVTNRNAAMVERLLKSGADANAALWSGETPLMTSAAAGTMDIAQVLLAHGADVNKAEPRRGQTALMWAIANSHPDIARLLIERGADVRAKTHRLQADGFTPMVINGYSGDVQATPQGGYTPLLFAVRAGDLETARLLLAKGASPNEGTAEDGTALVMASAGGYEELALLLLQSGADPNAKDSNGMSALHYALRDGMKLMHGMDIAEVIRVCGRGAGARCVVVEDPTTLDPKFLEEADIEYSSRDRNSILGGNNMTKLMTALLTSGADPNAPILRPPARLRLRSKPLFSLSGATPFFLATAAHDVRAMSTLVEAGAQPLVKTAVQEKEFFKEGFGDDNQIQGNATPLLAAAGMGRNDDFSPEGEKRALEAIKVMLDLGADVNEATDTGWTALHSAAYLGADSIIEFLASKGANVNARNGCGQTPLTLAEGTEARGLLERVVPHADTGQLLRKLGAVDSPGGAPVGRCVEGRFGLDYATVKPGEKETSKEAPKAPNQAPQQQEKP